MNALYHFFLSNPLLLVAVLILLLGLGIAIVKKVMKVAFILAIIIVVLGLALFVARDTLGLKEEVKPAEQVLEKANKEVEKTSPDTFRKLKGE